MAEELSPRASPGSPSKRVSFSDADLKGEETNEAEEAEARAESVIEALDALDGAVVQYGKAVARLDTDAGRGQAAVAIQKHMRGFLVRKKEKMNTARRRKKATVTYSPQMEPRQKTPLQKPRKADAPEPVGIPAGSEEHRALLDRLTLTGQEYISARHRAPVAAQRPQGSPRARGGDEALDGAAGEASLRRRATSAYQRVLVRERQGNRAYAARQRARADREASAWGELLQEMRAARAKRAAAAVALVETSFHGFSAAEAGLTRQTGGRLVPRFRVAYGGPPARRVTQTAFQPLVPP